MRKIDEVTLPDSCFNKALDYEMLFVLLARDPAGPATVRFWIAERIRLGLNTADDQKLVNADLCALTMIGQHTRYLSQPEGEKLLK